jgi:hypothetical protein
LIHNPFVQVYLVVVGGLAVAVITDRLRHPAPARDDDPTLTKGGL